MRRILSMETHRPAFEGVVLSLEEEQILLQEAQQDAAEVATDLNEVDRLVEVTAGLEDLAVIADGIEEATPAEVALIETAGDMAVAGTDIPAEEVVPAMEAYKGGRIATENIRDTAASIWRQIQAFVKKVWEKIEGFFYKIFGTIPGLRKRLEALEESIDAAGGKSVEGDKKKFKVSSGVSAFCVDHKPVKTEADLKAAVKDTLDTYKWIFTNSADLVAQVGKELAGAIGDFDPTKGAEEQAKVVAETAKKYAQSLGRSFPKGSTENLPKLDGFVVIGGKQLLGNTRLVAKYFKDSTDAGVLGQLDRYRRSSVELAGARDKDAAVPSEFDFATLSIASAKDLVKQAGEMLDLLEDFHRGKGWKEVKKVKTDLENASSKATTAMSKLKESEEASERAVVPYFRAVLNFNGVYAGWTQKPYMGSYTHGLTVVRAIMTLVQRSMAQYS